MKKRVIKLWDKIIVVLLGILGILNCNSCLKMYGMPEKEYESYSRIKGVVTDKETSNPLQNIQVIGQYSDTVYTDTEGRYIFRNVPPKFHLKIEDIDGAENGGDFETQEFDVKFEGAEHVKTVNIELETKK